VYKLYELTYDEVQIVDPAFDLTQEEYENFNLQTGGHFFAPISSYPTPKTLYPVLKMDSSLRSE